MIDRRVPQLLHKRAWGQWRAENHDVLEDRVLVGRNRPAGPSLHAASGHNGEMRGARRVDAPGGDGGIREELAAGSR